MAEVESLMAHRNRRERAVLLELLELSERVPIKGLAVCAITASGEILDSTGQLQENTGDSWMALMHLSRHLRDMSVR